MTVQAPWKANRAAPVGGFRCTKGKVVVELDPPEAKRGLVELPQSVQEDLMPDFGTVVAAGSPLQRRGKDVEMPRLGARVLVLPKHGKSVEGFVRSGRRAEGFTRFYGCAGGMSPYLWRGEPGTSAVLVPWWESILMELTEDSYLPFGDWVLLRHEMKDRTDSGLLLAESAFVDPRRSCKALVVACGPLCEEVRPGDTVVYHEGASRHIAGLERCNVAVREKFVYGTL